MAINVQNGKNKLYYGDKEIIISRDGMPSAYQGELQVYGGYDWYDGMLINFNPTSIIDGEGRLVVNQTFNGIPSNQKGFSNYTIVNGGANPDFTSSVAIQFPYGDSRYQEDWLTTQTNTINFPNSNFDPTEHSCWHSFPAIAYNWDDDLGFLSWVDSGDFLSITGSGVTFLFHFNTDASKKSLTYTGRTGYALSNWDVKAILNGGTYYYPYFATSSGSAFNMVLGFVPSGSREDTFNRNLGYDYIEAGFGTETIVVPFDEADWNGWHSIVMSYDNPTQKLSLYRDTTLITSSILSYGDYSFTGGTQEYFVVGAGRPGEGYFGNGIGYTNGITSGSYDGIGLWNRALHPDEVDYWVTNFSASRAAL